MAYLMNMEKFGGAISTTLKPRNGRTGLLLKHGALSMWMACTLRNIRGQFFHSIYTQLQNLVTTFKLGKITITIIM
jgi:hypothetical protein